MVNAFEIAGKLKGLFWSIIPGGLFAPEEGSLTLEKRVLRKSPSLESSDDAKYAVFTDLRFYLPQFYEKFIPFLPKEVNVIGPPSGQNCFMYCLGIDSKRRKFDRNDFDQELEKRGYTHLKFDKSSLEAGDVIVYHVSGILDQVITHSAIYVGNGRVCSRFGKNSPLIEHPTEYVVPSYWDGESNHLAIERK